MLLDQERCYRAVASRDARFDGHFITAVRTTGIYCRPSCPAVTPKRANVEFLPTAGAAQQRGYRACRRCQPDAVPGSPDWNLRADLAARAMRLITDGVVERDGVPGLASRLGYSERHLNRVLTAELGAGPLALARAHRAHTARLLVETTPLGMADIAFAAGFASVRQFNDTVREVYGVPPTTLRTEAGRRRGDTPSVAGTLVLRLPYRPPFDADGLLAFLGARALDGVESVEGSTYRRTLRLPHGAATVAVDLTPT
ncbi:MAG: bifunctional transcriptional activator/DNA repair enzyme AdaA, partial [Pseudonocardia sp.]